MRRTWTPAIEHPDHRYARRPEVGWIIAVERKPWVVVEVREHGTEDVDYEIFARPFDGTRHYGMKVPPNCWRAFHVLPEHFAVCRTCGELAPCHEHTNALYARAEAKRAEREMRLLPGCCPGCQEPITSRQRTIAFPGPYVRNPLAPADPEFHTRRRCLGAARAYEEEWVRDDPSRPRSLLTLSCEGTVIVHDDGSGECFGAVDSNCPSIFARHRVMSACYIQSHGCGRGCSRAGHPGTRLANRPKEFRL